MKRTIFGDCDCNELGFSFCNPVDEFDRPVERTKQEHPYSYDGFVTYRNGKNEEINNDVYSDRLLQWNYNKSRVLMQKYFGESGDYWSGRNPKKIQKFLSEYFDKPNLKLILIMEYCNVSSGYPVWRFGLNDGE